MTNPVFCILGDEGDDPSGDMFEFRLRTMGIDYFWLSRTDALAEIAYDDCDLTAEAVSNPYAIGIDPRRGEFRPTARARRAHAYLPVGATLPSYGALINHAFDQAHIIQPNDGHSVDLATDKWFTHCQFKAAGLPVPDARRVTTVHQALSAAKELLYPVVVKEPLSYGGMEVRLINAEEELKLALTELQLQRRHPLMIEQYIECAATDRRIVVVNGQVAGALQRKAPSGDFRANLALGGSGEPVVLCEEEYGVALRMAEVLNLNFVGLDVARSTATLPGREHLPAGALFCIEGNPTPGIRGLYHHTGVDVTESVVQDLLDRVATATLV